MICREGGAKNHRNSKVLQSVRVWVRVHTNTHVHTCTQGHASTTVANGHRHGKWPAAKKYTKAIKKKKICHHNRQSILAKRTWTTWNRHDLHTDTKHIFYILVFPLSSLNVWKLIYFRRSIPPFYQKETPPFIRRKTMGVGQRHQLKLHKVRKYSLDYHHLGPPLL